MMTAAGSNRRTSAPPVVELASSAASPRSVRAQSKAKESTRKVTAVCRASVNAYVVKPVDFHEFVNAIKELGIFWAVINEPPPGSAKKK
jgi:DNA-binding NarL/FixJ family response regulator